MGCSNTKTAESGTTNKPQENGGGQAGKPFYQCNIIYNRSLNNYLFIMYLCTQFTMYRSDNITFVKYLQMHIKVHYKLIFCGVGWVAGSVVCLEGTFFFFLCSQFCISLVLEKKCMYKCFSLLQEHDFFLLSGQRDFFLVFWGMEIF